MGNDEDWLVLGEVGRANDSTLGELSISLASLRKRGGHHELWERVRLPDESSPERRTLWAVKCVPRAMAKVLEASEGEFTARANPLRYYIPSAGSAGATIIDITCREIKQRLAARPRPARPVEPEVHPHDVFKLIRPPSLLEQNDYDEEED